MEFFAAMMMMVMWYQYLHLRFFIGFGYYKFFESFIKICMCLRINTEEKPLKLPSIIWKNIFV